MIPVKKTLKNILIVNLFVLTASFLAQDTLPGSLSSKLGTPADFIRYKTDIYQNKKDISLKFKTREKYHINAMVLKKSTKMQFLTSQQDGGIFTDGYCLAWGENLLNGSYKRGSCSVLSSNKSFNLDEAARFLLFSVDHKIQKQLNNTYPGDQISMEGYILESFSGVKNGNTFSQDTKEISQYKVAYVTKIVLLKTNPWRVLPKIFLIILVFFSILWLDVEQIGPQKKKTTFQS